MLFVFGKTIFDDFISSAKTHIFISLTLIREDPLTDIYIHFKTFLNIKTGTMLYPFFNKIILYLLTYKYLNLKKHIITKSGTLPVGNRFKALKIKKMGKYILKTSNHFFFVIDFQTFT